MTGSTAWNLSARSSDVVTPDWAKHVVWYQIMPERWRNGDTENDPAHAVPWTWDWFEPVNDAERRKFYGGGAIWDRQYGGDIRGMMESLDYLEDLGVTGIYFNPVFKAPGHHKYNTSDYRHIDDHFGFKGDIAERQRDETADPSTWAFTKTDRLFLDFLEEAHRRGFKIILDGVFNHSGTDFWAFQDIVKNGKKSPYRKWFSIRKWGVPPKYPGGPAFEYDGWAGFDGLPEYAEDTRGLAAGIREHVFDVTRRWMDPNGDGDPADGIDGWRLDVPGNVVPDFWVDWRKVVKGVNRDAYISGEIWDYAGDWLQGDHFDAVMNYEFTRKVYRFFLPGGNARPLSAGKFGRSMESMLLWYAPDINFVLQNLLGSHDVDRIVSAIHNRAGWKRGRIQDDNPAYDASVPKQESYDILKLIVTFQMTWAGAPMVYYGDEAGMFGADDPTNRMPMWWPDRMPYDNPEYRVHPDVLDHYRRLIAIRNTFPALRTGAARMLASDDERELLAFERRDDRARLIVALNNSAAPQSIEIPVKGGTSAGFVNLLDTAAVEMKKGIVQGIGSVRSLVEVNARAAKLKPRRGKLTVTLPPKGAAVLLDKR
ncbi:MAG: hypothetical protein A3G34_16500 [Candidatus Lindowbacteria bacterium RIFCSPLOWO2_12_FULL_62_27]|nr:MAG: hypothetical protein A3I06_00100 [Candidatus Lindowbacteria bacterium RIFCSPLOWO2_02_FULL_62_12]OGH58345.1 MAG: hypothetical protein A3G34_16500 [Candidatus Lindowbacteria bacterium RIFCSPLOWO2_12_FULL_62_27]